MTEVQQKLTDLCLICSEFMGPYKNGLGNVTQWSHKPLFQMFETFISINITQHELEERQICQNCLIKINELDEHHTVVEKIQSDLITLYNSSICREFDVKPDIKIEHLDMAEVDMIEDDNQYEPSEPEYMPRIPHFDRVKRKYNKRSREEIDEDKRKKVKKDARSGPGRRRSEGYTEGFTLMMVEGRKWYKCEICNKVLHRRLTMHRGTHSNERKVKCEECGALFKTLACLYTHRKIHRERKHHQCDICGQQYLQKVQLRKHIDAIHLKRKDHVCAVCGKSYSRDSTLQVHMLTHDGEKNVICTVCGFRTHTKSKMTRHMKSHTGERNYSCEICGKRFLYSYNVIAHVNYVHKGMRYKVDESKLICNICGKKFQKQKKVKEHMAEVHNISEVTDGSAIVEEGGEEVVEWIENY